MAQGSNSAPNSSRARGHRLSWRRDPVILARMQDVQQRHHAGDTNVAIAAALGVNEWTIRQDLDRLGQLWKERIGAEAVVLRGQAVQELDAIKAKALAAFDFDERAERAVLFGVDAEGEPIRIVRDDHGGAQFRGNKAGALNVARQAVMDKAKVLGIIVDPKDNRNPVADYLQALREFGKELDNERIGMPALPAATATEIEPDDEEMPEGTDAAYLAALREFGREMDARESQR